MSTLHLFMENLEQFYGRRPFKFSIVNIEILPFLEANDKYSMNTKQLKTKLFNNYIRP